MKRRDKGIVKGRPKVQVMTSSRETPSDKSFIAEKCRLLQQKHTNAPTYCSNRLRKTSGIDSGQGNIWCALFYNSDVTISAYDPD